MDSETKKGAATATTIAGWINFNRMNLHEQGTSVPWSKSTFVLNVDLQLNVFCDLNFWIFSFFFLFCLTHHVRLVITNTNKKCFLSNRKKGHLLSFKKSSRDQGYPIKLY